MDGTPRTIGYCFRSCCDARSSQNSLNVSSRRSGRRYISDPDTPGKPAHMPFRNEDTSAYGPEDLKILHEVFDLAWERLRAPGYGGKNDEEVAVARRLLAKCIMTNAKPGQLDVPLLFERCLGAFHRRSR